MFPLKHAATHHVTVICYFFYYVFPFTSSCIATKTVQILLDAFHLLHRLSQHIRPCIYAAKYVVGILFGHSMAMLNAVFLFSFILFRNYSVFSFLIISSHALCHFQKYVFVNRKNPQ